MKSSKWARRVGQYRVDSTDPASIEQLFREIGKVDGVVTATGKLHFGPLPDMSIEQFWIGLRDKLMGQINVVLGAHSSM